MNAIQEFLLNKSIASRSSAYDSGHDENRAADTLNWDAIVGAILAIGVGASFWSGAAVMIDVYGNKIGNLIFPRERNWHQHLAGSAPFKGCIER
jgi:hypothetical protein